jgi:DNA-binding transcriptional LysR family regulator
VKACFALDAGWIPVRVKKTHQEGLLRRCSSRSQYAAAQEGKSMRLRINVRGFDAVCRMVQANMGVGLIPDRAFEVVGAGMSLHAIPLCDEWARRELKIVVRDLNQLSSTGRLALHHLRNAERTESVGRIG